MNNFIKEGNNTSDLSFSTLAYLFFYNRYIFYTQELVCSLIVTLNTG